MAGAQAATAAGGAALAAEGTVAALIAGEAAVAAVVGRTGLAAFAAIARSADLAIVRVAAAWNVPVPRSPYLGPSSSAAQALRVSCLALGS